MIASKIEVLTHNDINRIHQAALDILENTGVRVENARLCALCAKQGLGVDGEIVKFKSAYMENLLNDMRKIHEPRRGAAQDDGKIKMIASAQSIYALDLDNDQLRVATQQDLADATRLIDALDDVALNHAIFIPSDVPAPVSDLHMIKIIAANATAMDAGNVCINSPDEVDYAIAMGAVIRGSEEELKKHPCFCHYCCATSPHVFGKTGLELSMKLYDRGFYGGIGGVMIIVGATAPITLFGALAVQTADVLAGLALNWILNKSLGGYCAQPVTLDMKECSNAIGTPESLLMLLATKEIAEYYGTPIANGLSLFNTDSKVPDVQAGMEKAYRVMAGLLAGWRSFSELGTFASCLVAALPQILVDREMIKMFARFLQGIGTDEESLALDLIKEKGIGANYIAEEHTTRNFRGECWFPALFDRRYPAAWLQDHKTAYAAAKEQVRAILKAHHPKPLIDENQQRELDRILRKAEEKLCA